MKIWRVSRELFLSYRIYFILQPKLADENINKLKKLKSLNTPIDPLFTIE